MSDPFDELIASPSEIGAAARASIEPELTPAPLETPLDTERRVNRVQLVKARNLSAAGIPSLPDPNGIVRPISDPTGAPLQHFDKRNSIAYDSTGNPQKLSVDESGAAILSDPFAAAKRITKKGEDGTYRRYDVTPGLPWRDAGPDEAKNQAAQEKEARSATSAAAAALGRQLSSDQGEIVRGKALIKARKKQLLNDVPLDPTLLGEDPKSVEGGPVAVHTAIDQHFDGEYARPEANAKKHFWGNDLSDEAMALRKTIDESKARAHTRAEELFSTQDAVTSKAELRAQRQVIEDQLRQTQLRDALKRSGLHIPGLDDAPAEAPADTADSQQEVSSPTSSEPPQPGPETEVSPSPSPQTGLLPPAAGPTSVAPSNPSTSAQGTNGSTTAGSVSSPVATTPAPLAPQIPGLDEPHAAEGDPSSAGVLSAHETGSSEPAKPPAESAIVSTARQALSGLLPAAATAVGGVAGATAAGTLGLPSGPADIGIAIAGGLAGAAGGAALGKKAQDAIMGGEWTAENQAQMDANMAAHPIASKIGAFIPAVVSMLGGAGPQIEKAAAGYLARIVKSGATPAFIQKAIASLPENMVIGARMGTGAAAQNLAEGQGSAADLLTEAAKGAVTMGPVAFVPGASTLLGAALGKAPADAAVLATANALYDKAVDGKEINFDELATDIGTDIPGFVLMNLFSGLTRGHPLVSRRTPPPGPLPPTSPTAPPSPPSPNGAPPSPSPAAPKAPVVINFPPGAIKGQQAAPNPSSPSPEPAAPSTIKPVPTEATPSGAEPSISAGFKDMGGGAVDNLYAYLFDKLQKGDTTELGKPSRVLLEAMPEFQSGRITNADQLRQFVATKYPSTAAEILPPNTKPPETPAAVGVSNEPTPPEVVTPPAETEPAQPAGEVAKAGEGTPSEVPAVAPSKPKWVKVYRGTSKSAPFNESESAWWTTSKDVADSYATEVMGHDDPTVIEAWVDTSQLPHHDIRELALDQEKLKALDPDVYGNPQKQGVYRNSDDSLLNVRHTVIHAPKEAISFSEPSADRSSPANAPTAAAKAPTPESIPHVPGMEEPIGASNVGAPLEKNVGDMLMMANGDHEKAAQMAETYKMPEVAKALRERAPKVEAMPPEPVAAAKGAPAEAAPAATTLPVGVTLKGENPKEYSKSSTQVTLPEKDAERIRSFGKSIPERDIYTDPEDPNFGRENDPHITALYGITSADPSKAAEALRGHGPVKVKLGKLSLFKNEKYDVLKADVESADLHAVNAKLKKGTEYESDFPDYHPHMTVAYLKPGEGAKYVGKDPFQGREFTFNEIEFRGKDGKIFGIDLGKGEAPKKAKAAKQPPQIPGIDTPEKPRAKLGNSPQTFTVEEALPFTKGDQPGEKFYRVKNERTNEEQIVESKDLTMVKGHALPEPVAVEVNKPKAPKQRRGSFDRFGDSELTPIASYIIENGGLMSKATAKARGKYERNGEEWDAPAVLEHPTHNKIYKPAGEMPSEMAKHLWNKGLISDGRFETMFAALEKESKSARSDAATNREQKAEYERYDQFQKDAQKEGATIAVDDLKGGDVIVIAGEEMTVKSVDPDGWNEALDVVAENEKIGDDEAAAEKYADANKLRNAEAAEGAAPAVAEGTPSGKADDKGQDRAGETESGARAEVAPEWLSEERKVAWKSILEKQGKEAADKYAENMKRAGEWRPSANVQIEVPAAPKPTMYLGGDLAEYTGEVRELHGGKFYVLTMLEGTKKGKEAVTTISPELHAKVKSEEALEPLPEAEKTTTEGEAIHEMRAEILMGGGVVSERDAIIKAATAMSGGSERLAKLVREGATDAELKKALGFEFGNQGGDGDQMHWGGENPRIRMERSPNKKVIQGKELLKLARETFGIKDPASKAETPKLGLGEDQGDLLGAKPTENTATTANVTNEAAGTLVRMGGQIVAKLHRKGANFIPEFNEDGQRLSNDQKRAVNQATVDYTKEVQKQEIRLGAAKPLKAGEVRSQQDAFDPRKTEDPLFSQPKKPELPWPEGTKYIDSDGPFIVFKDRHSKTIDRKKIGDARQAEGVAKNLTEELKAWKARDIRESRSQTSADAQYVRDIQEAALKAPTERELLAQGKTPTIIDFNRPNGVRVSVQNTQAALHDLLARVEPERASAHHMAIVERLSEVQDKFKGVKVRVLRDERDLPPDFRQSVGPDKHEAVVDPKTGEAFLFSRNIESPERAEQVLAHEIIGHVGVEKILPDRDWKTLTDSLFSDPKARTELQRIGMTYHGTSDLLNLTDAQRLTSAREFIARLAENPQSNPTLWRAFLLAVKKALRQIGFRRNWSMDEIEQLVRDSAKAMKSEPHHSATQPRADDGTFNGPPREVRESIVPVGLTPGGDKEWLRIPSAIARLGKGLLTEGARHVLDRTNNKIGKDLAKATRRHVVLEQDIFGQNEHILRHAIEHIPKQRRDAAFVEVEQHIRDVENKRPATPLAPDAQSLLDAWHDVGQRTGDLARANNVQVFDPKKGGYRPMGHVKNYIPRMYREQVEQVMRDPQSDPALFNQLAQDIATARGITLEEGAKELRGVAGRFSANDFMGNMEMARSEPMPESFYEYDLRNLAPRYLTSYAERMAQIMAYGQRLGPREKPVQMNLWDKARREAEDAYTQQWLNAAEDQGTDFKPKSEMQKNARRAQALASATLLSDPTSTVPRNLISGISATTEMFGLARSLGNLPGAARSANQLDAKNIGAIRDDFAAFINSDQLGDSKTDTFIRNLTQKALKYTGFTGSENLVRTHGALTAMSFVRDAAKALDTNPNSALGREALGHFKRWDIDPEKIVAEKGDWKTGEETRKFILTSVRELQGGYRFDQVPIWAGTTAGRFFYQYGRWGVMRAQNLLKNIIRPAIGEEVEFRGQKMVNRNVLPLMRAGFAVVGLGEAFGALAALLFDRDRRDATFDEMAVAWNSNERRAVALMGERIVNDIIMAGTLGLLGQPVDFIKSAKDQSRLKNPFDPPSAAGIKALIDLAQKASDQNGTLTKRDLLDAATALARGPKNVTDIARNATDEKLYEAQNDQRTLRNAARRWAKTRGLDVSSRVGGDIRKSPNAPIYERINEALLTGDVAGAKEGAREYLSKFSDKTKAKTALTASVRSRQPFRAGNLSREELKNEFMEWAQKNLPVEDMQQVRRVQSTYLATAKAAGLLSSDSPANRFIPAPAPTPSPRAMAALPH